MWYEDSRSRMSLWVSGWSRSAEYREFIGVWVIGESGLVVGKGVVAAKLDSEAWRY